LGRDVAKRAQGIEQWAQLNPGVESPGVPSDGPVFDEARIPIDRYHQP